MHIHKHITCVYMYIYLSLSLSLSLSLFLCIYIYIYIYTYIYICVCMYVYIYMCIYIYIYIYTHIHVYVYIYIYIYAPLRAPLQHADPSLGLLAAGTWTRYPNLHPAFRTRRRASHSARRTALRISRSRLARSERAVSWEARVLFRSASRPAFLPHEQGPNAQGPIQIACGNINREIRETQLAGGK